MSAVSDELAEAERAIRSGSIPLSDMHEYAENLELVMAEYDRMRAKIARLEADNATDGADELAEPMFARNVRRLAQGEHLYHPAESLRPFVAEYDRRGELLAKMRGVVMRVEDEYTFTREVVTIFDAEGKP